MSVQSMHTSNYHLVLLPVQSAVTLMHGIMGSQDQMTNLHPLAQLKMHILFTTVKLLSKLCLCVSATVFKL